MDGTTRGSPLARLHQVSLLGFDTETTGIDVRRDRVVSAALVRRDTTGSHVRT